MCLVLQEKDKRSGLRADTIHPILNLGNTVWVQILVHL